MPVSYYANSPNQQCFLTPAPFVSIEKSFDKAGDGEILGVRYTITLTGTIVADRGSPTTKSDAGQNGWLTDSLDAVEGDHVHADAYTNIMKKQQLMRNLFSKINEGGRLEIEAPKPGGTFIYCYPRIESVSFPEHAQGNPFIQPYTITLEADQLHGAGQTDNDDFLANGVGIEGQYISAAGESWDIDEGDQKFITRDKTTREIKNTFRTYTVNHTISATGKRRFDVSTDAADGIDQTERLGKGKKFWSKTKGTGTSSPTGEAWYQAREFVRKQLIHGLHFQVGSDATRSTDDDLDTYGINLPKNFTAGHYEEDSGLHYSAYNYVKSEQVDKLGGSFEVSETWLLVPDNATTTETLDISITEDPGGGLTVGINGNIQGLATNIPTSANETSVSSNNLQSSGASTTYKEDYSIKFANANSHFALIEADLYRMAKGFLDSASQANKVLNPIPTAKTIGKNPTAGTVTYNFTFSAGVGPCIPNSLTETVTVSDNYPGQTFASQAVIGRKLGPVLQDIGTQSVWKRTASISCRVDTITPEFCKNASGQRTSHRTSADCTGDTTETHKWVTNPNLVSQCVSNFNSAKPSMVYTITSPDTKSQRKVIRELIDSLKPSHAGITAIYHDPPAESWNPKTGDWSYNMGWTYEIAASYTCDEDVDGINSSHPDETQLGDKEYPGTQG